MISFQRLTLQDRAKINSVFYAFNNECCEYSFTNLFLWGRQEFAIIEDCIVLFSHWNGQSTYVYPVGSGSHLKAIEALMQDASERGIPFRLSSLTEQSVVELEQSFPGLFHFQSLRSTFDYIYDIHQLADLKGKKMQQKRNHINRFLQSHPDWQMESIGPDNLEQCRQMVCLWYDEHTQAYPEVDYLLEKCAIRRAFENFQALQMDGILIRVDGQIVAFTMGTPINDSVFDVNFEKAFSSIQGSYALINREFARTLRSKYPKLQYLNREDDMGLAGLRKSKESYYPDHLVKKFRACLAQEVV